MVAFIETFSAALSAMGQLALVVLAAALIIRRGWLQASHVKALSDSVVRVFLPCLIFSNITGTFRPSEFPLWWTLPLAALLISGAGLGLAILVFLPRAAENRQVLPLAFLQNAGYLVLPLGQLLFPADFDRFALYCFLYILVHNPLLWSVGKFLVSSQGPLRADWRGLLTPPLWANLAALATVFSGLQELLPPPLTGAIHLLGQATVPLATFILGASIGAINPRFRRHAGDIGRVVLVKLILLPAGLIAALLWIPPLRGLDPLLASMLVLQGASAPATSLLLAVQTYGGPVERVSTILLVANALCLFILPFWVALWSLLAASPPL